MLVSATVIYFIIGHLLDSISLYTVFLLFCGMTTVQVLQLIKKMCFNVAFSRVASTLSLNIFSPIVLFMGLVVCVLRVFLGKKISGH